MAAGESPSIEPKLPWPSISVWRIDHHCAIRATVPYMLESPLVVDKRLDGISNINDESDRDGMRIVITLKSDANANVVLNKLYKLTAMQSSFSVNNVALVNGRPRTLNLKEILQAFIDQDVCQPPGRRCS